MIYDIVEQRDAPDTAIAADSTEIDLSWLPDLLHGNVRLSLVVSANRDLIAVEIPA